MKNFFIGITIFLIIHSTPYSQLANQNTYLLRNLDSYQSCSACCGIYEFPSGKIIGSDIDNGLCVIKTNVALTGISATNDNTLHDDFILKQNYPNQFNPVNPVTIIQFSLKENSNVKLNIYNLQGKLVAAFSK